MSALAPLLFCKFTCKCRQSYAQVLDCLQVLSNKVTVQASSFFLCVLALKGCFHGRAVHRPIDRDTKQRVLPSS